MENNWYVDKSSGYCYKDNITIKVTTSDGVEFNTTCESFNVRQHFTGDTGYVHSYTTDLSGLNKGDWVKIEDLEGNVIEGNISGKNVYKSSDGFKKVEIGVGYEQRQTISG